MDYRYFTHHMIGLAYNNNPSSTFQSESHIFYWSNSKEVDFLLKRKNKLHAFEVGFQEDVKQKGNWMRKRFDHPLVLSKNQFDVNRDYSVVPVAALLYFI